MCSHLILISLCDFLCVSRTMIRTRQHVNSDARPIVTQRICKPSPLLFRDFWLDVWLSIAQWMVLLQYLYLQQSDSLQPEVHRSARAMERLHLLCPQLQLITLPHLNFLIFHETVRMCSAYLSSWPFVPLVCCLPLVDYLLHHSRLHLSQPTYYTTCYLHYLWSRLPAI